MIFSCNGKIIEKQKERKYRTTENGKVYGHKDRYCLQDLKLGFDESPIGLH